MKFTTNDTDLLFEIECISKNIRSKQDIFDRFAFDVYFRVLSYNNLEHFLYQQKHLILYLKGQTKEFDISKYDHLSKVLRLNKNYFFSSLMIWRGIKRDIIYSTKSILDKIFLSIIDYYLENSFSSDAKLSIIENFKRIILLTKIDTEKNKHRHVFSPVFEKKIDSFLEDLNPIVKSENKSAEDEIRKDNSEEEKIKKSQILIQNVHNITVEPCKIYDNKLFSEFNYNTLSGNENQEQKNTSMYDEDELNQNNDLVYSLAFYGANHALKKIGLAYRKLGFISNEDYFINLFHSSKERDDIHLIMQPKIRWGSDNVELALLFEFLRRGGLIKLHKKDQIYPFISNLFEDKEGKEIKSSSLSKQVGEKLKINNFFSGKIEDLPNKFHPIFIPIHKYCKAWDNSI